MTNNSYPLVSVAIITYNQKEYLRECIESILLQNYPNLQIVVADDCSSDGTQDLLLRYSQQYPNVFTLKLSEKNLGITANSNLAHFACRGKYIFWMGGDDLMLPGKIAKQVEYMENNPDCTLCYHNLDVFDSATKKNLYYFNHLKKQKINGTIREIIKFRTFNGACSTVVRKDKTPKEGFNELIPIASDWLYWVDTLANGGNIKYIDEVLGKYRRHDNNITKKTKCLSQADIDHLNTCNIIIGKYPQYLSEALYAYAEILFHLRKKLDYKKIVCFSLGANFRIRKAIALGVFLLSFGIIKV
ncbi:glycosyltransferase [Escherichia coli]|uniref:Glycosyl transferase family 2 n=1 Tax=Escherichia coli TaxID=562 RepID=A0A0D3QUJ7_ECOLX|nr:MULTISPECIES: glycosyltransferase [Enterobacteriaceae]EMV11360.1 glycosyl transferase 2 family protein [Escherichia coli MP021017.11]AJR19395.1 glycosyl transferase family 2 [Escherichia coli]APL09795.1 glycosyl transferase 2 family protein [Escherichia coli]EEW8991436.1 glycosyltransferase [Escherichia coli]EEX9439178.1 glycosyltransferase [Escherichia coli]